eukprot:gene1034-403_t
MSDQVSPRIMADSRRLTRRPPSLPPAPCAAFARPQLEDLTHAVGDHPACGGAVHAAARNLSTEADAILTSQPLCRDLLADMDRRVGPIGVPPAGGSPQGHVPTPVPPAGAGPRTAAMSSEANLEQIQVMCEMMNTYHDAQEEAESLADSEYRARRAAELSEAEALVRMAELEATVSSMQADLAQEETRHATSVQRLLMRNSVEQALPTASQPLAQCPTHQDGLRRSYELRLAAQEEEFSRYSTEASLQHSAELLEVEKEASQLRAHCTGCEKSLETELEQARAQAAAA